MSGTSHTNPVVLDDVAVPDAVPNALIDAWEPSPTVDELDCVFRWFRGFTMVERTRGPKSWVWDYGVEIQNRSTRRWVCLPCVRKRGPRPSNYDSKGTQNNVENHLWKQHRRWDPSRRRNQPSEGTTKRAFPSIVQSLGLVRSDPSHLAMANQLISGFDRDRFHALCVNWVVESQLSLADLDMKLL
ncbi:hypothetical protein QBC46DRAFT_274371 [Diplogelasinospora grovesii]|uniref:Uncharacterized protein n=1 Tax=Diplogelasinospora grovesii TaxID=303347 RepID=A0AAN6MVN4_9PEZI|nr:hypothetical protein QBC46DRAFT_274371 [Diplogelasinospora grovesii]